VRLNTRGAWSIHGDMRTLIAATIAASMLAPSAASAQVQVSISFDLPAVLPALVIIEPGIQVVPQVNEEVFFVDGSYWVRRDTRWYRSPDHRSGWVAVEQRAVPARLVKYPPGQYRKWSPPKENHGHDQGKHGEGNGHGEGKGHDKG
jgi:hypothetical protein